MSIAFLTRPRSAGGNRQIQQLVGRPCPPRSAGPGRTHWSRAPARTPEEHNQQRCRGRGVAAERAGSSPPAPKLRSARLGGEELNQEADDPEREVEGAEEPRQRRRRLPPNRAIGHEIQLERRSTAWRSPRGRPSRQSAEGTAWRRFPPRVANLGRLDRPRALDPAANPADAGEAHHDDGGDQDEAGENEQQVDRRRPRARRETAPGSRR